MTYKYLKLALSAGAVFSITACTAGQTGPPNQTTIDPTVNNNGQLTMAVGTANIAGQAGLSLNVVALYRQKNGLSAVLVDTPKLTGAFTLPAAAGSPDGAGAQYDGNATADLGPSATEVAGKFIGGSPQPTQAGGSSTINTTFGINGGVFGNGFAAGNYSTNGVPATYTPYYQPFYAGTNSSNTSNVFIPSGGAPAFDPAANGQGATGPNFPHNGLSLGLDVFQGVVPGAGAYTLNVGIPTTGGVLSATPASATLANPALVLPVATTGGAAPAVTFNGDGSLTVTNVTIAAPLVGAYVQVIDKGPTGGGGCNGASSSKPVYYTRWVTGTGPVTFANANAPYNQTVAVCTAALSVTAGNGATVGDNVQVVVIGFDYNEYALQYNGPTGASYSQAPALPAQADSSISLSTYATSI